VSAASPVTVVAAAEEEALEDALEEGALDEAALPDEELPVADEPVPVPTGDSAEVSPPAAAAEDEVEVW
jgi:hypothetical protein